MSTFSTTRNPHLFFSFVLFVTFVVEKFFQVTFPT